MVYKGEFGAKIGWDLGKTIIFIVCDLSPITEFVFCTNILGEGDRWTNFRMDSKISRKKN